MGSVLSSIKDRIITEFDEMSYRLLVPLALLLALAPFYPEPHLWETGKMLVAGELTEPIYIFDFLMHSSGLVILAIKIGRDRVLNNKENS